MIKKGDLYTFTYNGQKIVCRLNHISPSDMGVSIVFPFSGNSTGSHIPYFAMMHPFIQDGKITKMAYSRMKTFGIELNDESLVWESANVVGLVKLFDDHRKKIIEHHRGFFTWGWVSEQVILYRKMMRSGEMSKANYNRTLRILRRLHFDFWHDLTNGVSEEQVEAFGLRFRLNWDQISALAHGTFKIPSRVENFDFSEVMIDLDSKEREAT